MAVLIADLTAIYYKHFQSLRRFPDLNSSRVDMFLASPVIYILVGLKKFLMLVLG
jgi:hypothetical protein